MGAAAYAESRVGVPAHDAKGRGGGPRHAKGVLKHDAIEAHEGETFMRWA